LLLEHPDEALALAGDQRLGARLVHHGGELCRHDEQRPSHPEHPDERAAAVQRVLEVGGLEAVDPCPGREEDRRGIARVQPDNGLRGLLHGRDVRGQAVTRAEPRPALPHADPSHPDEARLSARRTSTRGADGVS
jgi:hypothetical protein